MNKQVVSLPLALIDLPAKLPRQLDRSWAEVMAVSFREHGQHTPILVKAAKPAGRHELIAGLHRLEAARIAGWDRIDAICFDGNDLAAELAAIDENLVRRELSVLDRAVFLAERKRIYLALHPEVRHGGDRRPGQVITDDHLTGLAETFDAATAKKLGLAPSTIRKLTARADRIPEALRHRLAGTRFADSGSDLDALARRSEEDQAKIVDELLAEQLPAPSVRDACLRLGLVTPEPEDPVKQQFAALLNAWGKNNNQRAQRQFLDHLAGDRKARKLIEVALGRITPAEDDEA